MPDFSAPATTHECRWEGVPGKDKVVRAVEVPGYGDVDLMLPVRCVVCGQERRIFLDRAHQAGINYALPVGYTYVEP